MATRMTQKQLEFRVSSSSMILERPFTRWNPGAAANEQNVGHLFLEVGHNDRNGTNYKLMEVVTPGGGEREWSNEWMYSREMMHFLDGIIKGMALRNAHLGQYMMKSELDKNGVFVHPTMYSEDLIEAVRPFVKK